MSRQRFYKSPNDFSERFKLSPKIKNTLLSYNKQLITVLHGAAQCGKSVAAAISLALMIETSKDNENLFAVCGYTEGTAKANSAEYLQWYFTTEKININCKFNNFSCAEIQLPNRPLKRVLFLGASTASSNNAWHGQRICGFILDELDRIHENSITEALQRITTFENPHIICTMNATFETHPVYALIDAWIDEGICKFIPYVLNDSPVITEEKIQEIKKRYPEGTANFKRFFLGEKCSESDNLFMTYDYNILQEFDPSKYLSYICVADIGETLSNTSFGCFAIRFDIDKGKYSMDLVKHYRHLNRDLPDHLRKKPKDYANDFAIFVLECKDIFNKYPIAEIIDDSWYFFTEVKNAFIESNLNYKTVIKPIKDPDSERINKINGFLFNDQLHFYKANDALKELNNTKIDKKLLEKGKISIDNSYNNTGHNDFYDILSYAIAYYDDKLGRKILK